MRGYLYHLSGWVMWFAGLWWAAKFVAKHRNVTQAKNNRWADSQDRYDKYPYIRSVQ